MRTTERDQDLLDGIAAYFDTLASDSEACLARGIGSKTENRIRAKVWREAAADVRSIELV